VYFVFLVVSGLAGLLIMLPFESAAGIYALYFAACISCLVLYGIHLNLRNSFRLKLVKLRQMWVSRREPPGFEDWMAELQVADRRKDPRDILLQALIPATRLCCSLSLRCVLVHAGYLSLWMGYFFCIFSCFGH
jgi:hypothetical protein